MTSNVYCTYPRGSVLFIPFVSPFTPSFATIICVSFNNSTPMSSSTRQCFTLRSTRYSTSLCVGLFPLPPSGGQFCVVLLTCICLRRGFFRVTSRTSCNIRDVTPGTLTATDTCVGYHVTRFEASRSFSKRYHSYALRKHMCGSGFWEG
jgi:hypothetical protein